MLEAHQYNDNAFVTLTYDDEHLPKLNGRPTLLPEHTRDWLKRFRKAIEPHRIRYFLVGEYGDETERPHYHVALFNFPTCARLRTRRRPGSNKAIWSGCCASCDLVGTTWGKGDVDLGTLEADSAQYVCGYVTKKLTRSDDYRLKGRLPEFARMSLRPGIGADAMHEVASQLMAFNLDETLADVPSALRHGSRELPLGRYLTKRLRKLTGKDERCPDEKMAQIQNELSDVRQTAFDNSQSFASALKETNAQKTLNFVARNNIFKGKRQL